MESCILLCLIIEIVSSKLSIFKCFKCFAKDVWRSFRFENDDDMFGSEVGEFSDFVANFILDECRSVLLYVWEQLLNNRGWSRDKLGMALR